MQLGKAIGRKAVGAMSMRCKSHLLADCLHDATPHHNMSSSRAFLVLRRPSFVRDVLSLPFCHTIMHIFCALEKTAATFSF